MGSRRQGWETSREQPGATSPLAGAPQTGALCGAPQVLGEKRLGCAPARIYNAPQMRHESRATGHTRAVTTAATRLAGPAALPPPAGAAPAGVRTYSWLVREAFAVGACARLGTSAARAGKPMAKARHPRRWKVTHTRTCAWCSNPLQGNSVTVTFPDKERVMFHIECLDQYRAVMWPRAPR